MSEHNSLRHTHHDYTVGWVSVLRIERSAAVKVLDRRHPPLPQPPTDENSYTLGSVGNHNVVLLSPSNYGTYSVVSMVAHLRHTFPAIRHLLIVGVGGGVPGGENDIRLGDVVVSKPENGHSGVIPYDFGKSIPGGSFVYTGSTNKPSPCLLNAAQALGADMYTGTHSLQDIITSVQRSNRGKFTRPSDEQDRLFAPEYEHTSQESTCRNCDITQEVIRPRRHASGPRVHHGLVGSANRVVKDGLTRDRLVKKFGMICFEMEAAGLMDILPSLVIRGISDYSDSHKNGQWQAYASLTAAAYAKALLNETPIYTLAQPFAMEPTPIMQVDFNSAVDDFLGRDEELNKLRQTMLESKSPIRRKVVLHGLGGIGKTQLALRFAREYRENFSAIFWITADNRSMLLLSLASMARNIPEISETRKLQMENAKQVRRMARRVLNWLGDKRNLKWLLIYDNAGQDLVPQVDGGKTSGVMEFFPPGDHGAIIITTRLQKFTEVGISFPVCELGKKPSMDLLMSRMGKAGQDFPNDSNISELSIRLGGLPLALVIAGSYISVTKSSAAKYLQLYAKDPGYLQGRPPPFQYQHGSITDTLASSFEAVLQMSEHAANLLLLLSCFHHQDIWFGLLQYARGIPRAPGWLLEISADERTFKNTIGVLVQFSLIPEQKRITDEYSLHPVVQSWCQDHLQKRNRDEFANLALVLFGLALPKFTTEEYWRLQERFIPHANHMLELLKTRPLSSFNTTAFQAIHNLGEFFFDQMELDSAEFLLKTSFEGLKRAFGPNNPDTLDSLSVLAITMKRQIRSGTVKDPIEVERLLKRARDGYMEVFGPNHLSTITAAYNHAILCLDESKPHDTEQTHLQVLADYLDVVGPDHPDTLRILNTLAIHYKGRGMLKQAESRYLEALEGFQKVLGGDHSLTLDVFNNMGNLYLDQGKLAKAEEAYQNALSGRERILGSNHPQTLNSIHGLGIVYKHKGQYEAAEERLQQALDGYAKALHPHHPQTLDTANNLGDLYFQWGKPEEAKQMYDQALQGRKHALGPHHPATLETITCLAILYKSQGRIEDAQARYEEALRGYRSTDKNNESAAEFVWGLGRFYHDQGRLEHAESMYQEAYLRYKHIWGSDHHSTLEVTLWLGILHLNQGKRRKAKERFREAFQGYQQTLGSCYDTEFAAAWLHYVRKPIFVRNWVKFFTGRHPTPLRKCFEMRGVAEAKVPEYVSY
ncbi:uncharacterized protein BJX67DRAFT_379545 [Aspergillus lucknowensis]|uniref:Nucleoside phosphorylase domain-containing protein n=1 Tax=Aspergillus lucknowensis TaxID=176173 RepID=A0ABR4LX77_9EURO